MTWRDLIDTPGFLDMYLRALLAGGAVVTMCAVLSVLVVVKKLGFVGQGVSHSAFGGIGVASVIGVLLPSWGFDLSAKQTELLQMAIIIGFCIAAALGMAAVSDRSGGDKARGRGEDGVPADTAIGLFLVASMAIGAVLVQVSRRMASGASGGGGGGGGAGAELGVHPLRFHSHRRSAGCRNGLPHLRTCAGRGLVVAAAHALLGL